MSRSTEAAERWRGIVAEQAASGLGVGEFCRRRGLPASSLFAWRRRLTVAAGPAAAFVEARVQAGGHGDDDGGSGDGGGGPVDAAGVEIICHGGRRVVVRPGFDRRLLLDVIRVLEGLPSRLESLA